MLTEIAGEDTVLKIECFLKKVKKVYWDNRNRKMTETTTLSPLVSIIVPVYNVERYIKRCVDSLRRQTLQNIEIILMDRKTTVVACVMSLHSRIPKFM